MDLLRREHTGPSDNAGLDSLLLIRQALVGAIATLGDVAFEALVPLR